MNAPEKPESEAGREPEEGGERRQTGNLADDKHPVPLFLKDRSDGRHGDEQDEKDGSAE